MKAANPMYRPEALEKMRASLTGRPFPTKRGGNGRGLSEPQRRLAELSGLPTEHVIATAGARAIEASFGSLPTCYKVDLAELGVQLAIEVDGMSHNTALGRRRDQKKEAALRELGWSVLRFSNAEVLADPLGCLAKIQSTISTLRDTKTTSLKAA
jgi:Protein of unknown function (DUF559)